MLSTVAESGAREGQRDPSTRPTRSIVFLAPNFCKILARWNSTVRWLIPRAWAASRLVAPFTIWSRTARSRSVNRSRPRKGFEKIWLLSFNGFDFPMMRTPPLPVDSHRSVQMHRQYRSTGSDRPWQVSEITLRRLTQIQFGPGGTNYRPQRRAFCCKRVSEAQL